MSIDKKALKERQNYLSIDYGKSKIGLATADSETRIAFGYGALKNDNNLYANLETIINSEEISKVIIGIPRYMEKSESCFDSEKLGQYLKNKAQVEVVYFNEMFSTKMAQDNLREKGARNISSMDDEEAARVILEDWLNFNSQ